MRNDGVWLNLFVLYIRGYIVICTSRILNNKVVWNSIVCSRMRMGPARDFFHAIQSVGPDVRRDRFTMPVPWTTNRSDWQQHHASML